MSVENLLITSLMKEGSLKLAYKNGLCAEDFDLYQEEFKWIEDRLENNRGLSRRAFQQRFADFDWFSTKDRLTDLIKDFKDERAFIELSALVDDSLSNLEHHNALERAEHMRDVLADILKNNDTPSDVFFKGHMGEHIEEMRRIRKLRKQGQQPGITTGVPALDKHWDGLVNGRMIVVLGRPGEGKTFFTEFIICSAMKDGARIGFFSPEMDDFEHRCRIHTILSADKEIQEASGCNETFKNRSLMRGTGFHLRRYGKFCRYIQEEISGEVILFTHKFRREKISTSFIESRIDDLALDMIVIDPIYKLKLPRHRDGNRFMAIAEMIDRVETIAKFNNIPVVITNQANRQSVRKGEAPHKDSSFGTDSAAQEASHLIGVHSSDNRMEVYCSKSRFGSNFRALMKFYPNDGILEELEEDGSLNGNYSDDDEESLA